MTTPYRPPTCPVCGRTFQGAQGLGGHLKVSKDPAHTEHRKGGKRPKATASPSLAGALPPPALVASASPASPNLGLAPSSGPSSPRRELVRPEGMSDFDWGCMKAGEALGNWMNRRREQRRLAAQAAPPPTLTQRPSSAPAAAPQEDPNEAYWRNLLGTAYCPPNLRRHD